MLNTVFSDKFDWSSGAEPTWTRSRDPHQRISPEHVIRHSTIRRRGSMISINVRLRTLQKHHSIVITVIYCFTPSIENEVKDSSFENGNLFGLWKVEEVIVSLVKYSTSDDHIAESQKHNDNFEKKCVFSGTSNPTHDFGRYYICISYKSIIIWMIISNPIISNHLLFVERRKNNAKA